MRRHDLPTSKISGWVTAIADHDEFEEVLVVVHIDDRCIYYFVYYCL